MEEVGLYDWCGDFSDGVLWCLLHCGLLWWMNDGNDVSMFMVKRSLRGFDTIIISD
jgi:hypothetical protein